MLLAQGVLARDEEREQTIARVDREKNCGEAVITCGQYSVAGPIRNGLGKGLRPIPSTFW